MPTEDRRIIFSNEEVYNAIFSLCAQKKIPKPPPGHVQTIREDSKDESKIFLDLENPQDTSSAQIEYSRDFLAAALLLFCRGAGIPVAKNGKKTVLLSEGQVVLRVYLGA